MNYSMFLRGQMRNDGEIRTDYMYAAGDAKSANQDNWAVYMVYLLGA